MLPQPFAHPGYAHPDRRDLPAFSNLTRHSSSPVFDSQDNTVTIPMKVNRGSTATRVTMNVRKTLLNNPEQICLDIHGQTFRIAFSVKLNFDAGAR
jgi:hypothetical protein